MRTTAKRNFKLFNCGGHRRGIDKLLYEYYIILLYLIFYFIYLFIYLFIHMIYGLAPIRVLKLSRQTEI